MYALLKLFVNVLIVGLFLYSKLLLYKDKLKDPFKGIFAFFNSLFAPLMEGLKKLVKPFEVGQGLSVDMSQIILLIIFLVINYLM